MTLLEYPYFLGYMMKKRYAFARRKRLPYRVISVGNLTLGGTGKTPAVIALAENALRRGISPCILTRGYGGKAEGPCLVSAGQGPLMDAPDAGDEAILMAERLAGVPIVKGKNRYQAGVFAIETLFGGKSHVAAPFVFILDDGFQHWALHRDLDILLIDGTNPFGNRKLFPMGILREPLSAIRRADVIVISRVASGGGHPALSERSGAEKPGESIVGLVEEVRRHSSAPLFYASHDPVIFMTPSGSVVPLAEGNRKRIFGFCGIGNPRSFRDSLQMLGGEVTGFIAFRDHHRYRRTDLRRISDCARQSGAEWIVTTEKDIMKLKEFPLPDDLLALRIAFHVDDEFYTDVFDVRRE